MTTQSTVTIGSVIKSFDFPHITDHYLIGTVTKIHNGVITCDTIEHVVDGKTLPKGVASETFSTNEQGLGLLDHKFQRIVILEQV